MDGLPTSARRVMSVSGVKGPYLLYLSVGLLVGSVFVMVIDGLVGA